MQAFQEVPNNDICIMNSFLLALQFLTIIPIRVKEEAEEKLSCTLVYFPVVGLLLGLILSGLNFILTQLSFYPLLINTILVVALIILTGALHLDGLADTLDALASGKDRQGMLEIMRDPHIGTMGALGLVSVVLLKIAILSSLDNNIKNMALIFMCVLSRWSLIAAIYLFPYARNEGKAKAFFGNLNLKELIFPTAFTLFFVCLIWRWRGLLVFAVALIFMYISNRYAAKRIGGITGDVLGATLELNEVFILAASMLMFKGGI